MQIIDVLSACFFSIFSIEVTDTAQKGLLPLGDTDGDFVRKFYFWWNSLMATITVLGLILLNSLPLDGAWTMVQFTLTRGAIFLGRNFWTIYIHMLQVKLQIS